MPKAQEEVVEEGGLGGGARAGVAEAAPSEVQSVLQEPEAVNLAVRRHGEDTSEWGLNSKAKLLYRWFDLFNAEFFGGRLPTPEITFERTPITRYGHYVPGRNAHGVLHNINLNEKHLDRGEADLLRTLLHEMLHEEEVIVKKLTKGGSYHSVMFRARADALGIPSDKKGHGLGMRDPFVAFLKRHGIDVAAGEVKTDEEEPKTGTSKLKKWVCDCGYGVRVAIRDFKATCNQCNQQFRLSN